MGRTMKYSRNVDKDVVLCETTNRLASKRASDLLLSESVPFTKCWHRIPFFKRASYNGASQVCIISISRTQYGRARRVLGGLEHGDFQRLTVNLI